MLSLIKATAAASAVSAMANGASPAAGSNPSNTAPLSPLQTNMMLNSSAPMSPGSPHHSHHQHTHQHLHSPHFPLKRHRAASTPSNQSPDSNSNTERDFCKDLYCCGFHLKDLHQLQLHGEMFHGGASMAALASILELRTCKAPAVLSPVPLPSKLSIELSASSLSRRSSDCSTSGVNPPSQPANEAIDIDEDMKVGFDDDETMSSIGASLSEELKLDSNMCSGDDDLTEAADFFKNAMKPIGVFESSGSSTNTGSQSLSHDPALLAAIHYVETMRISPPVPPRSKAPIAIGAMLSPVLTLPARDIDGLLSPVLALPPSHEPGILMPTISLPTSAVDCILPPILSFPSDESDDGVIVVSDEAESPVVPPSELATVDSMRSVATSPVPMSSDHAALKDIRIDFGETQQPNKDFTVDNINTSLFGKLDDESSGQQMDSDSDSDSSELDYENCDDEDSFVMDSVTASRASNPGPSANLTAAVATPTPVIDIYAPRQLRAAVPQSQYSFSPVHDLQERRKRGRPKLNRYLLPPTHPKYLPPPPRHLIPQLQGLESTSEPGTPRQQQQPAIRVKLRIPPRVASTLQTVTTNESSASTTSSTTPDHPLSPPQSIHNNKPGDEPTNTTTAPPPQAPTIDESVIQDLGPAAAAAMRRRLRDATGASASSTTELYLNIQKAFQTPSNGAAPTAAAATSTHPRNTPTMIIGPDGVPVKRGRGRPRKKLRPDEIFVGVGVAGATGGGYFDAAEAAAAFPYLMRQGVYGDVGGVGISSAAVLNSDDVGSVKSRARSRKGRSTVRSRQKKRRPSAAVVATDPQEESLCGEDGEGGREEGWGMDEFGCDILGDESGEEEDQGQQLEKVAGFEGGSNEAGEGEETDAMVGVDQEDSVEATTTVDDEVTQPALEDVPEPLAPSTPLSSEADAFVDAMQVVDQETIVPTDSVNPTVTETLVGIVADSVNTQEEKSENAPQEAAAEKTDIIDEGKAIVEDRLDVMDLAEPVQPAPSAKATAKPKKSRKKPPTKAASTTTTAPETVEETEDVDLAPAAEPSSEKENKKKRSSPKTSSRKTRISVAPAAASRDAEMNETPILDVADESGKVESIDETSPTKSKDSEIDVKVEESSEPRILVVAEENKSLHRQLHAKLQVQLQKLADDERRKKLDYCSTPSLPASTSPTPPSAALSSCPESETAEILVPMREANTMGLTTANIISSIVAIAANNAKRRAVPTLPIPVPRTHPTSATLPSPTAETSTAASGMDEPHSDPLLSPVSLDKLNGTDSSKESSGPSYRRRLRLGLLSVIPEGSTEKRYVCPACGKDYKNANGVKYHLNRFHSDGYGIPSLLYVGGVGGVGVGGLGGDGVDGEDGEDDDVTQTTDVVPAAVAAASAAVVAPVFSTTVGDEERPIVCFLGSCDKNFKNVAGYKYHVRTVHASLVAEAEHRNILVGFEVPDVQQEGTSRSRLSKGKAASKNSSKVGKESVSATVKNVRKRKSPSPMTDGEEDGDDNDSTSSHTNMDIDDNDEKYKIHGNKRRRSVETGLIFDEDEIVDVETREDDDDDDEEESDEEDDVPLSRRRSLRTK